MSAGPTPAGVVLSAGPTPAGVVLSAIAMQLCELRSTLEAALQAGTIDLVPAALAQVRLAGHLADTAAAAMGQPALDDGWLCSAWVTEALHDLQRAGFAA